MCITSNSTQGVKFIFDVKDLLGEKLHQNVFTDIFKFRKTYFLLYSFSKTCWCFVVLSCWRQLDAVAVMADNSFFKKASLTTLCKRYNTKEWGSLSDTWQSLSRVTSCGKTNNRLFRDFPQSFFITKCSRTLQYSFCKTPKRFVLKP